MRKLGIIIPAGGAGTRMAGGAGTTGTSSSAGVPKQFMSLGGEPVLARTIRAFQGVVGASSGENNAGAEIIVALPAEHFETWRELCKKHDVPPHKVCKGGATRFESVKNALGELSKNCEYIAVHDAARPLVSGELILRAIETAHRHGTAIPAVGLTDSIRRVTSEGENGEVSESHAENRASLRAVQTPQVFRADILRTAYERALKNPETRAENFTDDATVAESVGYNVALCRGERSNIKITEPLDMTVAETILKETI